MASRFRDKPLNTTSPAQPEHAQSERTLHRQKASIVQQVYLECQLGSGLLLMFPSSDNSCGKGACCLGDKSESEWVWVSRREQWWNRLMVPMSEYPAVSRYRVTSTSPFTRVYMANTIVMPKLRYVCDSMRSKIPGVSSMTRFVILFNKKGKQTSQRDTITD